MGRANASPYILPTKPESLNYFRVLLPPRCSRGHCFLAVLICVVYDGLSERETACSLEKSAKKSWARNKSRSRVEARSPCGCKTYRVSSTCWLRIGKNIFFVLFCPLSGWLSWKLLVIFWYCWKLFLTCGLIYQCELHECVYVCVRTFCIISWP